METSQNGIDLIKFFEGTNVGLTERGTYIAYLDKIAQPPVWTIGWGLTKGVYKGLELTIEQIDERFRKELAIYEDAIESSVDAEKLNQNQFDALVSFTYNCGPGAFKKSIAPLLNAGKIDDVPKKMLLYVHAGKNVIKGLVNRRRKEAALFLEPVHTDNEDHFQSAHQGHHEVVATETMPQRVEEVKVPTTTAVKEAAKESPSFLSGIVGFFTSIAMFFEGLFGKAGEVTDQVSINTKSIGGFDALFVYLNANKVAIAAAIVIASFAIVIFRSIRRRQ